MRLKSAVLLLALVTSAPTVQAQQAGFITTPDSARLFYRMLGRGPDTLIAIHGGPGVDLESIAGDFQPLTERHVVIYYDQRGTGRSTLPRDTMQLTAAQQILDLDAVRARFKLERVTLVAHSYGPLLAATYAIAHPDRVQRMVFFGPVPPRRGDFWTQFGRNLAQRTDSGMRARMAEANKALANPRQDAREACHNYWLEALRVRLAEPDRTLTMLRSDLCASDPRGIRYGLTTTNRLVMASYGDWDLREQLKAVKAPTLIIHGEQEAIPMDLVREWTNAMTSARLFQVPRAAHFTYAERPELVWPEVERFLAGGR